ncbi:MAG TPA: SBBP repeat-containing protein [Bryobacteraceae bacterium]|nr:SBBP repeat-containing protein [Bryobacteraceae bacterium]
MRRTCFVLAVAVAALSAQTPQDDKRLVFSTYLGGERTDDAVAVATDGAGNIFVAGKTESIDFPGKPLGGFNMNFAVPKGYLTKYSPDGKQILWSHVVGGSSNTRANAVVVDKNGNVYVAGTTGATDLQVMNPVQAKKTGLNIPFLMKFDNDGKLLFSTYLGGDRNDEGLALAVDSRGNMYLAGRASSSEFPVKNAMQPKMNGSQDAFVAKFTPDYQLAWATYLGGTGGSDNISAIAVTPDDYLVVTGETGSPDMQTPGVWGKEFVHYSSYVAKLAPEGNAIVWWNYIADRSGYTVSKTIAVDGSGRIWAGGQTTAKRFRMTENAIQPAFAGGRRDGFLLCLTADGTAAEYFTYLGGSTSGDLDPDETVESVAIDARGHVIVTGETITTDFPVHRNVQPYRGGGAESYLLKLDPGSKQIVHSTFWGGAKREVGTAVAVGPGENITVVGETYSEDLPLQNALRKKLGATTDAFVMRFCEPWLGSWPSNSLSFGYTIGQNAPEPQSLEIYTGCSTPFDMTEAVSDQPWLRLRYEGRTAPFKLTFEVVPSEMAAGDYTATVKVKVPAAFYQELTIPVRLVVAEPPPVE